MNTEHDPDHKTLLDHAWWAQIERLNRDRRKRKTRASAIKAWLVFIWAWAIVTLIWWLTK